MRGVKSIWLVHEERGEIVLVMDYNMHRLLQRARRYVKKGYVPVDSKELRAMVTGKKIVIKVV